MFLFAEASNSFSVCTCAKCGSTSLFMTLYAMISGSPWGRKKKPYVHDYEKWGLPNVTNSFTPGKLHLIMTRDPVERYVSAFNSKVKCCEDGVSRCYQDLKDHFVPALAKLAGMLEKQCFTFEEYVTALENVHRLNRQKMLNGHFIPQTLACRVPAKTPTLVFDVHSASEFLRRLRGMHLHSRAFLHTHRTSGNTTYNVSRLRILSRPEYGWVDRHGDFRDR